MTTHPMARPKTSPPVNWYLPTNHLNLYYMMGAGLILPENGFGKKYYKDLLSLFPGQMVLFADTVPAKAIEMVRQEASHLIASIAHVSLDTLTGPVISIDRHGKVRQNIAFPEDLTGEEAAVIIPAPLPISWVTNIYFDTMASVRSFKESADDLKNVACKNFKLKMNKKLFETPKKDNQLFETPEAFPWPQAAALINEVLVCLDRPFAAGGIMSMLHKMADKSRSAVIAFQLAFDLNADVMDMKLDPLIHRPWQWGQDEGVPATGKELSSKMFWGLVDAIAGCNRLNNTPPKDAVIHFLKTVVATWQGIADNEKLKNALDQLIQELDELTRISDSTVSELLDRHPKPFSRAVILFFLRDNCQGLLDYHHERLNQSDILSAAILFGARDGVLNLPFDLKDSEVLQHAVSHRMAVMAHHLSGTGIGLGAAPLPPPIFRELFSPTDNKWSVKQKKAALVLAKHNRWDCIQTVIDLGKGEYQLNVSNTGVQIIIAGTEKNLTHEVNRTSFLRRLDKNLSEQNICGRLDLDLRKIFGCKQ